MNPYRFAVPVVAAAIVAGSVIALALLAPSPPAYVPAPEGAHASRMAPSRGTPGRPASTAPAPVPPRPGKDALAVRGFAVDEDGEPLEGVRILLVRDPGPAGPPASHWAAFLEPSRDHAGLPAGWSQASSGRDGSFEFAVPEPGRCLLLAGPPRYQEAWLEIVMDPGSPPAEATLMLRKGLHVRGRVAEWESGAGVPGAAVSGFQRPSGAWGQGRMRRVESGPDGSFVLEGFGAGAVELRAEVPPSRAYALDRSDALRVEAGSDNAEIRVVPVGFVEFRAVDESGGPCPGAIRARLAGRPWNGVVATLEQPGEFLLSGPSGARDYLLETEGFAPVLAAFDVVGGSRTSRADAVVFRKGVVVSGSVVLEGAGPDALEGVRVFIARADMQAGRVRSARVSRTGAREGRFEFAGLGPGTWRLVALAPGFRAGRALVPAAEAGARRDFRLEPRGDREPAPEPAAAFRDRKDLVVDLDFQDLSLGEALDWIAEISETRVRVRQGTEVSDRPLALSVPEQPLVHVMRILAAFQGLEFDEEKGELFKRKS